MSLIQFAEHLYLFDNLNRKEPTWTNPIGVVLSCSLENIHTLPVQA